jgi:4-amino-4-deoxychorismate lyase
MKPLSLAVLGRGLVDPDEPVLAVDDVALSRGQAAFETIRVYAGRPFALDAHLERLAASAARLELPAVDRDELAGLARLALEAAGTPDCALRLYWTGGREGEGRATAMAMVSPLPGGFDALRKRGLRVVTLNLGIDLVARAQSKWLLAGVKSTSYAINMAARAEAARRGADDALLFAADGTVLEGATSNVWWRSGNRVITPALDLGILAGVTRTQLLRDAATLGYAVAEGAYPVADLLAADEVFLSSSLREVAPVVQVDGRPIGDGRPGPAAAALQAALRRDALGEAASDAERDAADAPPLAPATEREQA